MKYITKILATALCLAFIVSSWGCKAKDGTATSGESAESAESTDLAEGVDVKDLDYSAAAVLIQQGGSYTIDKEIRGTVVVHTKESLTLKLKGATVKSDVGPAIYVVNCGGFTLELTGENTISDGAAYSGSFVYAKGALASEDDVSVTGSGSLTVTGNSKHGIVCDDALYLNGGKITVKSAVADGVHVNDLIELNGADLTVESAESDAVECEASITVNSGNISLDSVGDGLAAKSDATDAVCNVSINGGNIKINTKEDGIQSDGTLTVQNGVIDITTTGEVPQSGGDQWQGGMEPGMGGGRPGMGGERPGRPGRNVVPTAEVTDVPPSEAQGDANAASDSSKGLKATGLLTVNGGTITVNSTDDAVHSDDSVIINNGTLTLSSGDDGIHAENDLTVNGGAISITKSYEGLEGKTVTVNNGDVSIASSDDGINATSGNAGNNRPGNAQSDNSISIKGGRVYVNVSNGDGIDSNGSFLIEGGIVSVYAGASNGNSPLDADGSRVINGGVTVAAGTDGMLENPQASSTQCSLILTGLRLTAGDTVALKDAEGKILFCYTLEGSASSLTISMPELAVGNTYTLYTGVTPAGDKACGNLYYGDDTIAEGGSILKEVTLSSAVTQSR